MRQMISLLTFATLLAGQASAACSAEVKSSAVGDVQIMAAPATPTQVIVIAILNDKAFLRRAVAKVAPAVAESPDISDIANAQGGPGPSGLVQITVDSYDERVPADKLLQQLADALQTALRQRNRSLDIEKRRVLLQEEAADELAASLHSAHDKLVAIAAESGLSANAELSAQRQMRMETELHGLEVELQGLLARRQVLEVQIAELAKKVAQGAGADPAVLEELKKSVDARMKIVEYRQAAYNTGGAGGSVADLEQSKDELARAEVELAKYRRAAAEKAGGGRIGQLKRRLDDTAIEMAEIVARYKALEKLLKKMARGSGQLEMQRLQVERLKRDYVVASDQLNKLRLQMRLHIEPQVRVIPVE